MISTIKTLEAEIKQLEEQKYKLYVEISNKEHEIHKIKFNACDHDWEYMYRIHGSSDNYKCRKCGMEDIH